MLSVGHRSRSDVEWYQICLASRFDYPGRRSVPLQHPAAIDPAQFGEAFRNIPVRPVTAEHLDFSSIVSLLQSTTRIELTHRTNKFRATFQCLEGYASNLVCWPLEHRPRSTICKVRNTVPTTVDPLSVVTWMLGHLSLVQPPRAPEH